MSNPGHKIVDTGGMHQGSGSRFSRLGFQFSGPDSGIENCQNLLLGTLPMDHCQCSLPYLRSHWVSGFDWYRGTSLMRNTPLLGTYIRTFPRGGVYPGGGVASYERGTPVGGGGGRVSKTHPPPPHGRLHVSGVGLLSHTKYS